MASWNICRGLNAKEAEIKELLNSQNLDLLHLQETDIREYKPRSSFHIQGYEAFTHAGDKKRTITLVKENCFHSIRELDYADGRPEVWLEVKCHGGKLITIGNIYREHQPANGSSQMDAIEALQVIMEEAASDGKRVIMCGDLNLDFSDEKRATPLLRKFKNTLLNAGYGLHGFGETFTRKVKGTVWSSSLDWLITNAVTGGHWKKEIGTSDHHAIGWHIHTIRPKTGKKTVKTRNLRKLTENRSVLLSLLLEHPWESLPGMELDNQAEALTTWLCQSLDQISPMITRETKNSRQPRPSETLQHVRKQRDAARRQGNHRLFKRMRNKAVLLSRQEKQKQNQDRIQNAPNSVWQILKEVQGQSEKQEVNIKDSNGKEVSGKLAADEFCLSFLEKIRGLKEDMRYDPNHTSTAEQHARRLGLSANSIAFSEVTEDDVLRAIRKSKNSKTTDIYGISPYLIKLLAPALIPHLTFIINQSLLNSQVPLSWKTAKVIPLHKKKAKNEPKNYRPVSILPSFSKVLEAVVKEQLERQLEALGVFPRSQHGFRRDRSTVTAVASLEHDVRRALHEKKKAGALLFDLSAAFDTIDANILCERLRKYGAKETVCDWLHSYLSGRKQTVLYQGENSDILASETGAPQGSALSPLLFITAIADIDQVIRDLDGVFLVGYADDTTLVAVGETVEEVREKLQKGATLILQYMRSSGLVANPEKTHFIMFTKANQEPLEVGHSLITESNTVELLGIRLSKTLSWQPHIAELEVELKKRIGILRRLSWHLPRKTMVKCLTPVFTSKLCYGLELITKPPVFTETEQQNCSFISKLQILHNDAMRAVLNIRRSDRISQKELLRKSNQLSVAELASRATTSLAYNFFSSNEAKCLNRVQERFDQWQVSRDTRQREAFPPQKMSDSLLARLAKCWNTIPEEIKKEDKKKALKKIKQLYIQ